MKEQHERNPVYMPPEALGLTEEQLNELSEIKPDWKHFTPEFVDTHHSQFDAVKAREDIKESSKRYMEARITQPEAHIKIKTNLPISIVFMGDLHIGSIYTNHDEIDRKFKKIIDTPNTYVFFMSNLIDNAIPAQFPDSMLANAIPPDQQVYYMRAKAQELNKANKVLGAITSPCHEGWTWKKAGQDINALIFGFKGRTFPVLENGGPVYIELPNISYMGAAYHQVGPFESQFNETHALRQMNRLNLQMRADFVVGAHKHFAAADEVYEGMGKDRRVVAYIRSGSEKGTGELNDQWSIGRYGSTGEPSGQVLHLFPFTRGIACEVNFDTGILAHEAYYLQAMVKNDRERTKR